MEHKLSKMFNDIFYNEDLKRPWHKVKNTFDTIMHLIDELLRGEEDQSLHKCIREINDLIEKCRFYPSKKSDDLVNGLYNIVTSGSFYEEHVVDIEIVRQAHYLTLIYFKRTKEQIMSDENLSNPIDLFIKTLIVFVRLNISLQMSTISKASHIKYYDFVFEHKPFEISVGIIEQIHIMYVYYEYLKNMNVYSTHSFESDINRCFEDIKAIVAKNNVPIDFEKYKTIKNRYEYVFNDGNSSNGTIDDYINVLLYDERARRRYMLNQNFNFDGTSEEGYSSYSENRAFEHQFFIMDGFLNVLESRRPKESKPPKNYLAFADVGSDIEDDEFIGFNTLEEGLSFYNTNIDELLEYRDSIADEGALIWSSR